jgi:hypothetical protein
MSDAMPNLWGNARVGCPSTYRALDGNKTYPNLDQSVGVGRWHRRYERYCGHTRRIGRAAGELGPIRVDTARRRTMPCWHIRSVGAPA